MSEVPDDVKEQAARIWVRALSIEASPAEAICAAILAERKRCANACRDATNSTIGEAYAKIIMRAA